MHERAIGVDVRNHRRANAFDIAVSKRSAAAVRAMQPGSHPADGEVRDEDKDAFLAAPYYTPALSADRGFERNECWAPHATWANGVTTLMLVCRYEKQQACVGAGGTADRGAASR